MVLSKEDKKEYDAKRYEKFKEKFKEKYEKNKETINEKKKARSLKHRKDIKQHTYESLVSGKIIDQTKWSVFCQQVRHSAENKPYPIDFTNDMMFEKMVKGCYYCMDIATTLDRIDSSLDHTPENCVGSCWPCNQSKGNGDLDTFLRKAFYRTYGEYFDTDENIWADNVVRPKITNIKKGVEITLTKGEWDVLISKDCSYCHRPVPEGKYNGVDQIIPGGGYVAGNVVSCCNDCNHDKGVNDVNNTKNRNERIAIRMKNKELVLGDYKKVFRNKGKCSRTKKVCANGLLYSSQLEASRELGKYDKYVSKCILNGIEPNNIFTVSNEFYNKYINYDNITLEMFIEFEKNM